MTTDNASLKEELLERSPHLNPNEVSQTLYDQRKQSLFIEASQRVGYQLVSRFDAFCSSHDIGYFAIANTLEGAVTYGEFNPGEDTLDIGMLRADYLKLREVYYETVSHTQTEADVHAQPTAAPQPTRTKHETQAVRQMRNAHQTQPGHPTQAALQPGTSNPITCQCVNRAEDRRVYEPATPNGAGFTLIEHADPRGRVLRRMPLVQSEGFELVCSGGELVYDEEFNLPLKAQGIIRISVFDAIPNDYDFARFFFQEVKQLNNLYESFAPTNTLARGVIAKGIWKLTDKYNSRGMREVGRLMPTRSRSILLENLLPLKRIPFDNAEICVPNDTSVWVVEDVEAEQEQVGILQADARDVVREIDRICRANGIGYFVCGGTMLGKVRHGGFIPWDDDIDVGMLRADYERFLQVAAEQLDQERFFLQTRETDPNIPYLFSKVRLKGSEYLTRYNEFRDFDKGICVDIFPFDKMPYEDGQIESHLLKVKKLIRAHNKVANRQVGDMPRESASNAEEAIAHFVMSARHAIYWHQSLAKTQRAYEKTVTAFNDRDDLHFVASYVATFTCAAIDDLLPYQDVEFEGLTLSVPRNPEVFLQMQYGDFMTEPLPHQQRGHGLVWWSNAEHDASEWGKKRTTQLTAAEAIPLEKSALKARKKKTKIPVRGIAAGIVAMTSLAVFARFSSKVKK